MRFECDLELIVLTPLALRAGQKGEITMSAVWVTLAVAELSMSQRFFHHCDRPAHPD
ncbi:MAG: hypothetical protein ACKVQT_29970 [Burkholderiales bacterium]